MYQVAPAARDMREVLSKAVSKMTGDVEYKAKKLSIDWKQITEDISRYWQTGIAEMIAGTSSFRDLIINSFNIIASGVGSAIGKTVEKALKSLGDMAGPIGSIVAGIVTAAISLIGKLFGVKSAAEKAAEAEAKLTAEAKNVQKILSSLGEITEATAKKYLELKKKFGMATAEAMSLATWMKETGITIKNFNEYGNKLDAILTHIGKGLIDVEKGTAAADEAFSELLAGAKKLGLEGSAEIVKFILHAREMGLEIASVTAYVQTELNKIPAALASLIAGFDATGGSIEDMGELALLTFEAMTGSGMSWIEAVNAMKEPLAALRDKYAELGITGNTALEELFKIVGVTEAHKELFKAIEANKIILEALGNTGWLTQEAMTVLTNEATDYYKQLKEAGLTSDEALRAMAPTLQRLQDYAAAYGFKIDEATQCLINQARAAGYVKDTAKDATTVMGEGFDRIAKLLERIAKALGADISDLLDEVGDKTKDLGDAAKDIGDKWEDAGKRARDAWDWEANPEGGDGGGKGAATSYQHGGIAWQPQMARLAEHEPEIVMPLSKYHREGRANLAEFQAPGMTIHINQTINAQTLDRHVIDESAELLYDAIERQARRRGG
jgi:hypothetical protein